MSQALMAQTSQAASAADAVAAMVEACEVGLLTMADVAEKIDDHFMCAELVQFTTAYRELDTDLRQAMLQLDWPRSAVREQPPTLRPYDTALSDADRHHMLLNCLACVRRLQSAFHDVLLSAASQSIADVVELHLADIKQIHRHLRVMQEMVNDQ